MNVFVNISFGNICKFKVSWLLNINLDFKVTICLSCWKWQKVVDIRHTVCWHVSVQATKTVQSTLSGLHLGFVCLCTFVWPGLFSPWAVAWMTGTLIKAWHWSQSTEEVYIPICLYGLNVPPRLLDADLACISRIDAEAIFFRHRMWTVNRRGSYKLHILAVTKLPGKHCVSGISCFLCWSFRRIGRGEQCPRPHFFP